MTKTPILPWPISIRRRRERYGTTKVIYNCLDPEHLGGKLPIRSSFRFAYPRQLQDRVLRDWAAYGYPDARQQGAD